jgi:hypothetical protein
MNVRIERVMNYENLDAKIVENVALVQKIWVLNAFKGKMVILGGSGQFWNFWSGWRALVHKDKSSCVIWGFFEGLEWVMTYL